MKQTLYVEGMTCQHCENAVKEAVRGLDGVSSVTVHLETNKVDVTYNESSISLENITEAIEDQGYDVVS